jgi:membrane protease YdiL (CAAX protease family)
VPNEAVFPMMLQAGLMVAGGGAFVAASSFLLARRGGKPLFAPVGPPRSNVNGFGVLGGFLVFVCVIFIVQNLLNASNFFPTLYGADFPKPLLKEDHPLTDRDKEAQAIRGLWGAVVAFFLQVGLIVYIVKRQGGPNPLHLRSVGMNITSGYLTWLMITPAAFSVFILANIALARLTGQEPDKHPLTLLGENARTLEWTLLILQTVCFAPLLEELIFRGVLLPWLSQKADPAHATPYTVQPWMRTNVIVGLAFSIALAVHWRECVKAIDQREPGNAIARLLPALFILTIVPVYWLVPHLHRLRKHLRVRSAQQARAIVASSALFAAFHASVWPSPVPLFVLAMGLGYLAIRTRSLVGPVVVHGMFNAVSALYLVRGGSS